MQKAKNHDLPAKLSKLNNLNVSADLDSKWMSGTAISGSRAYCKKQNKARLVDV